MGRLCERLGLVAAGVGPLSRFDAVARAYSDAQGLSEQREFGATVRFDRLSALGIPMFGFRLLQQEKHQKQVLTDEDWAFVADAERRVLARVDAK